MPKIAVCWRTSRDIRHHTCWTCSLRSCRTTLICASDGNDGGLQNTTFRFAVQLLPGLHLEVVISWYPHVYKECGLLLLVVDCEIWPVTDDGAVCMSITDWLVFIPLLWDIQAGMLADTPGDVFACLVVPVQVLFWG